MPSRDADEHMNVEVANLEVIRWNLGLVTEDFRPTPRTWTRKVRYQNVIKPDIVFRLLNRRLPTSLFMAFQFEPTAEHEGPRANLSVLNNFKLC
jgi:hypothetical protein